MPADGRLTHLLPALKGAPAALLLALTLQPGLQTTKSLARATGYSNKVVRRGLATLRELGLARNEPDMHAWFLAPEADVAALLYGALQTAVSPPYAVMHTDGDQTKALHNVSTDLSTGAFSSASPVESSAPAVNNAPQHAAFPDMAPGAPAPDLPEPPNPAEENDVEAEESSAGPDKMTPAAEKRAASRAPDLLAVTTADHPNTQRFEAVSKDANGARAGPPMNGPEQTAVASWLRKGGVAYRSTKMKDLLAAGLPLEVVRAHVLERLAWEAGLAPELTQFGVGLLIRKLLDGDPPPPERCPDCLHRRDRHGRCRCHLEAIIRR